jgi:hypothetical protein
MAVISDDRDFRSNKDFAADELGYWGHAKAITVLEATMKKEQRDWRLPSRCVRALGMIRDKRAIEALIDGVGIPAVGEEADGTLRQFTRADWGGQYTPDQAEQQRDPKPRDRDKYEAWLKRRQARWRAWWKENQDKVELDRRWIDGPVGPL